MKYLFKLLIAVSVLFLSVSACSDFLDRKSGGETDDETTYLTIAGFDRVQRQSYVTYRTWSSKLLVYDLMADNLMQRADGIINSNFPSLWQWGFTTGNTYSVAWDLPYGTVEDLNNVITRLESGNYDHILNQPGGKDILASALVFRALFHFEVAQVFAKSYAYASDSDLGIPYRKVTGPTPQARNTVKDVYKWILEDVEKGIAMMSDNYNVGVKRYLNKKSAHAIAARIYLVMSGNLNTGEFKTYLEKARDHASDAVVGNGSDISPISTFPSIWTGALDDNKEVLLYFRNSDSDGALVGNMFGQAAAGGTEWNNSMICTYSLRTKFLASDVRTAAYLKRDVFQGYYFNGIKKYRERTNTQYYNIVDIMGIRTSEMYLIRAEANARLGVAAPAQADLMSLMSNRYSPVPAAPSDANLLETIYEQRRLELAFEGHRWFDLKRLHLPLERDTYGDKADGSGTPSIFLRKEANSPYWVLPIPTSEMGSNPLMIQNTY